MGFVAHHLIRFTREALRGEHNASFYAAKAAEAKEARERTWWENARRRFVPEREAPEPRPAQQPCLRRKSRVPPLGKALAGLYTPAHAIT